MGWGSGINSEGRLIGYNHPGRCEYPGCDEKIDLGLAYCCGGLLGVEGACEEEGFPCGHYFCGEHLYFGAWLEYPQFEDYGQLCPDCADKFHNAYGEDWPSDVEAGERVS